MSASAMDSGDCDNAARAMRSEGFKENVAYASNASSATRLPGSTAMPRSESECIVLMKWDFSQGGAILERLVGMCSTRSDPAPNQPMDMRQVSFWRRTRENTRAPNEAVKKLAHPR